MELIPQRVFPVTILPNFSGDPDEMNSTNKKLPVIFLEGGGVSKYHSKSPVPMMVNKFIEPSFEVLETSFQVKLVTNFPKIVTNFPIMLTNLLQRFF